MNSKASVVSFCLRSCTTKTVLVLLFVGAFTDKGANAQDFWQKISDGSFSTFAINSSGHIYGGTARTGVFRSTDNGNSWTNIGLQNTFVEALAINAGGNIFAGTSAGVFRSTNSDDNWSKVLNDNDIWALTINSSGHIFAGSIRANTVFRSLNNGDTWVSVNNGLSIDYFGAKLSVAVGELAINTSEHVFAGTLGYGGVFRSTNNGESWIRCLPLNTSANAIAINSNGHAFAGTDSNGVFRSKDNGENWSLVYSGLPSHRKINALSINSSGHIFVGIDSSGVFRSTDNGESWIPVNTGLTSTTSLIVRALAINSDRYIFASTRGGVFRSMQPTTAVKTATAFPLTFELAQNYPNPFNPSTTIEYVLPRLTQVELKVYDILGHDVRTLVSDRQSAGKHRVLFDAKDIPAGLYFYRIKAGELVQTKKLILLK